MSLPWKWPRSYLSLALPASLSRHPHLFLAFCLLVLPLSFHPHLLISCNGSFILYKRLPQPPPISLPQPHNNPKDKENTGKVDPRPETYLLSASCKVRAHLSSPQNQLSFLFKGLLSPWEGNTPSGSQLQAVTLYNLFCRTSFDHHELATARKYRRGRKERKRERERREGEREGAELSAREEEEKMYV